LIGGETAEMPGLYGEGDYDLAGFAVGAVERDGLLPRKDLAIGDVLIALPSSGVHANGFSLVRRVVSECGLDWNDPAPFAPGSTLGAALLAPTRIYVRQLLDTIRANPTVVKALAHITGGGLLENLPRVLPAGTRARIETGSWQWPDIFNWLQSSGNVATQEMYRTFNCGVGMVIVAAERDAEAVLKSLGDDAMIIGSLQARDGGEPVRLEGKPWSAS
jgi:phosphoribosylformylglycinamidine cyclo-ligase